MGGCWIIASALALFGNGFSPVVYSISFEKFPVVGGCRIIASALILFSNDELELL